MAGHAAEHGIDLCLNQATGPQIRKLVQNVQDQPSCIHLTQDRGHFAHGNGAPAEGIDRQAQRLQVGGKIQQTGGICV